MEGNVVYAMKTGEKIALATAVIIWAGIAIGLVFSLINVNLGQDVNTLSLHIKTIYFLLFLLVTFIGLIFFKIFFKEDWR